MVGDPKQRDFPFRVQRDGFVERHVEIKRKREPLVQVPSIERVSKPHWRPEPFKQAAVRCRSLGDAPAAVGFKAHEAWLAKHCLQCQRFGDVGRQVFDSLAIQTPADKTHPALAGGKQAQQPGFHRHIARIATGIDPAMAVVMDRVENRDPLIVKRDRAWQFAARIDSLRAFGINIPTDKPIPISFFLIHHLSPLFPLKFQYLSFIISVLSL